MDEWMYQSFNEVYADIGGINMQYYYIVNKSQGYDESGLLTFDFDEENRKKIYATINFERSGNAELDFDKPALKNSKREAVIQFPKYSLGDIKVRELDAIDVATNGESQRYIILGTDSGVLLNSVYTSVRVVLLENVGDYYN